MPLDVEEVVDIPGLSGEEIIVDFCEQLAARLRRDCNLRPADSYVNGYSAEITGLKLKLYGIDTAEVEIQSLTVGKQPAQLVEGTEVVTTVETDLVVAHEPDLVAVRERSQQEAPEVESVPAVPAETAAVKTEAPQRRRYSGGKPARVASGGAESVILD